MSYGDRRDAKATGPHGSNPASWLGSAAADLNIDPPVTDGVEVHTGPPEAGKGYILPLDVDRVEIGPWSPQPPDAVPWVGEEVHVCTHFDPAVQEDVLAAIALTRAPVVLRLKSERAARAHIEALVRAYAKVWGDRVFDTRRV